MRIFLLMLFFALVGPFMATAENLPEWLFQLREAVYEQKLNAERIEPIYHAAKAAAVKQFSGADLDIALSRCEYFMGRAYQFENRKSEAAARYAEGLHLAERAKNTTPSAAAWVMMSENLSQACVVRPNAYAIANGLNVGRFAENALVLDSRNAAAQYIIAARWVYAPGLLSNHKKGIEMMKEIITNGDMEKDDRFNVYSAIGYAYIQQKKYAEAKPWLIKSLEIYPSNKYAGDMLKGL